MTDEFGFDIPAPGKLLETEIHPHNQALLDEEVARRLELAKAKLGRWQLRRVTRELAKVHRQLNRAGYNQLVTERDTLLEEYHQLVAVYRSKPDKRLKTKILKIKQRVMEVKKHIHALLPTVKRFEELNQRVKNHQRALQVELEEKKNREAFYREAGTWEQQILAVFRQSRRLHHFTQDSKGNEVIHIPKIERIIMKPDKIYYQVKTVRQGWLDKWFDRWHSALPYGVDIVDLASDITLANMTAACGRVVTVERSPRSQNLFYVISRMDSPDGIPRKVMLDQITDFYPADRHTATPWGAGIGDERKIVHFDFEQFPNILIAGSAGGGKSNLINAMLSQLIMMNSPDELRLLLIDNKGGVELSHFDEIPHLIVPPVIAIDGVVPALKLVHEIMTQRLAAFQEVKARKLLVYNQRVKNPMPRLVVVIDEMASLLGLKDTPEIHNELRVISSQGRATGVHLVVSTQHPSVDVLPGWIKTNLTLRIATRMPNHTASQIIVDSITAAHLPEVPGRAVFRRGGFELILQTPLIEDDGIAKAVQIAREFPEAQWQLNSVIAAPEPDRTEADTDAYVPPLAGLIEEPKPKFTEQDYIRVALSIGGRLSPARIHEIVTNEVMPLGDLRKMSKNIICYKEIEFEGVRYQVKKTGNTYVMIQMEVTESPTEISVEMEPDIESEEQFLSEEAV